MNRKLLILLAALAIPILALSACGDDDDETTSAAETTETTETTDTTEASGGGAGGSIEVVADPSGSLEYETGELSAKSGTVTIDFENPASVSHDVRIEGPDGNDLGGTEVISESSTTAEVELAPGTYTYYCSVGGHRAAGMEGTLRVK